MGASPVWKVYDQAGKYRAACKDIEAAASLMGFYGYGATIRHDHKLIVWVQSPDEDATAVGYDEVIRITTDRISEAYPGWAARQS